MCAEAIFRRKHQLPNRIARGLGRIRRKYKYQSCSLICQEHNGTTAMPWFERRRPEKDHEQSF